MDNELKHYGVLGMKWGHRKTKLSNKPDDKLSKDAKTKVRKGIKVATAVLGVAGGVAISALLIKNAHVVGQREGMLAAQKELSMFRRAAAAKGVATKAANKAAKAAKAARAAVGSTLSSMGRLSVQDFISMVR